jgi:hypothetical protein
VEQVRILAYPADSRALGPGLLQHGRGIDKRAAGHATGSSDQPLEQFRELFLEDLVVVIAPGVARDAS